MKKTNTITPVYLLFILSLGYIMAVLDTTGVVLAVPHIETDMRVSLGQSIWIINAYTLALGSLLLLSGNLTTKYGAKRILLIGMTLFTLASLGCSFSPNIETLIILRFIQGFGASLFMPSSLALLFVSYPDSAKRARMLGIWTAIISVATGTGSFIGGIIINYFGWRGIFLINIPLGILTVISILVLVKNNIANAKTKIDIFSNLFLVATIGSLVIYLVEGNQYGYSNSNLLLLLLLFILFSIGLVIHDKKSKAPIVPHQLLKNANFIVSNLLGLVVNISLYGIVLVLGLYFQTYLNLSSMVSGLLILPGMIVLIIGGIAGATLNANKQIGGLFGTTIMGIVTTNLSHDWNIVIVVAFMINVIMYIATWLIANRYLYGKK